MLAIVILHEIEALDLVLWLEPFSLVPGLAFTSLLILTQD